MRHWAGAGGDLGHGRDGRAVVLEALHAGAGVVVVVVALQGVQRRVAGRGQLAGGRGVLGGRRQELRPVDHRLLAAHSDASAADASDAASSSLAHLDAAFVGSPHGHPVLVGCQATAVAAGADQAVSSVVVTACAGQKVTQFIDLSIYLSIYLHLSTEFSIQKRVVGI